MELILSDQQRLLKDSAEKFFQRLGGRKRARGLRNSEAGFDPASLREMGAAGWLGMLVPEEHGGLGLGPYELALILEQSGRALGPEPLGATALAALTIAGSDNATARDALLPPIMGGESIVMPAFEEDSGSLDLAATAMRAERDGGGWRLSGSRNFVEAAGVATGFLVSARGPDGPMIFHVPRGARGLDIALAATVDGRPYGRLTLDSVQPGHVIAGPRLAEAALERHQDFALLAASAELLGVMEGASELTLEYMKIRKQFGRAIGSFQALQHRAVDNYILIESTRSLLYQTCERGEPLSSSVVSALKAFASGAGLTVGKTSVQMHGAIGFTDEYDVGLYFKRAMWLSAHLGNETAHRKRHGMLTQQVASA